MKDFVAKHTTPEPVVFKSLSSRITTALEAEDAREFVLGAQRDNTHALDLAKAMEDISVVIGQVEDMTPIDTALIQSAANMAVSGTDIPAEGVIPMGSKESQLATLLTRIAEIINSFMHNVHKTFEALALFIVGNMNQLNENKKILSEMHKSFPIPDSADDDVEHTVTMRVSNLGMFMTNEGLPATYGDFINAFNKTVAGFKVVAAVNTPLVARLMSTVRDVVPAAEVRNASELKAKIEAANKILFDTSGELWANIIARSDLEIGRDGEGNAMAITKPLFGTVQFGVALNLMRPLDSSIPVPVEERAAVNRSFAAIRRENSTNVQGDTLTLTGVNNASLQKLITKIMELITDIEQYAKWCKVTAEVATAQCSTDIVSINRYFSTEATELMPAEEAQAYRALALSHVEDVNSIINMVSNLSMQPLEYMNALVNDLVIGLSTIPDQIPAGDYNEPKPAEI